MERVIIATMREYNGLIERMEQCLSSIEKHSDFEEFKGMVAEARKSYESVVNRFASGVQATEVRGLLFSLGKRLSDTRLAIRKATSKKRWAEPARRSEKGKG